MENKNPCSKYSNSNNHMEVSINGGTPKSSILMGFSLINQPFWGTPFMETPILVNDFCPPFQSPHAFFCFTPAILAEVLCFDSDISTSDIHLVLSSFLCVSWFTSHFFLKNILSSNIVKPSSQTKEE